jgi:hypothetical protein
MLATPETAHRYPNAVVHDCYHFHDNPNGVAKPAVYPEHDYKPSTLKPADARRPWCGICRGTHGDEQMVDGGDNLLPPGQYQQILLLGESVGSGGPSGLILPSNR